MFRTLAAVAALALALPAPALPAPALPTLASAQTASFVAVFGGKTVGHLIAVTKGDTTTIDFDIKNNGRGPTDAEVIKANAEGLPIAWTIKGATTFGGKVDKPFSQAGAEAIAMVVKDGAIYFPSEVYPRFGVQPFTPAPKVTPVG
jgi:hypothetical protein